MEEEQTLRVETLSFLEGQFICGTCGFQLTEVYQMALYHVWFSTKGRKPALEGEVGDDIRQFFVETAQRTGIRLLESEVVADHAHLLIAVSGAQTLPSVMHQLKGASARAIFLKYPELKVDLGHNSFWQKGYGWRRIRTAEAQAVRHYIRTQRDRPIRRDVG